MTPCNDVLAHLPLFVGGDLEAPLAEQVRDHLGPAEAEGGTGCASCRQALERLRAARQALLELPARSPAPRIDVWPGVAAVLASEGLVAGTAVQGRAGGPRVAAGRLHRLRRRVAAAAAVLIAALGLAWGLRSAWRPAPGGVDPEPERTAELVAQPTPAAAEASELLVPVATGGLRRLEPGEALLGGEALPFVEGLRGWVPAGMPARPHSHLQPIVPTLASDRAPR